MFCHDVTLLALCLLTLFTTIMADKDKLDMPKKEAHGMVNYNHEGPRIFENIARTCANVTDKVHGHEFQIMYGMFLLPLVKGSKKDVGKAALF